MSDMLQLVVQKHSHSTRHQVLMPELVDGSIAIQPGIQVLMSNML
jgi:hypothetical protein